MIEKISIVAYQGTEGAYSTLAATNHFGARKIEFQLQGHLSFQSLMEAVRDGAADSFHVRLPYFFQQSMKKVH